jgi:hypothetical protein
MPKNEVVSTDSLGSSIALRLFYKNPYAQSELDEYAEVLSKLRQYDALTKGFKYTGSEGETYNSFRNIPEVSADEVTAMSSVNRKLSLD